VDLIGDQKLKTPNIKKNQKNGCAMAMVIDCRFELLAS